MDQNNISTRSLFSPRRSILEQPAAIDFIQNRLPAYHPAFEGPPAYFDLRSQRYIRSPPYKMHQNIVKSVPAPDAVASMPFWNEIFPAAMAQLQKEATEPRVVQESNYRVRDKSNWTHVQRQLQTAQDAYLNGPGIRGRLKDARRTAADKSQPAVQAVKFVPSVDMIAPVVNTVQNLLEVVQYAAKVRQDTQLILGNLNETFVELNFVLGTFPKDFNVQEAGINLVTAILETIEKVIAFYLKPTWKKIGSAMFQGDNYESEITYGIENIKLKSEALVHQGRNSHVYSSRREAEGSRTRDVKLMEVARTTNTAVHTVEDKVVEIGDSVEAISKKLDMFDHLFALLYQAEKAKVMRIESNGVVLVPQAAQATTPSLSAGVPHHGHVYAPNKASITPADLWSYMNTPEIEEDDMRRSGARQETVPIADRGRTERIISIERFKNWLVSPQSGPFLVLGDCQAVVGVTALTLFCSTLTQAFRKKDRFISLAFFCDQHREDDPYFGSVAITRSFIAQLLCQYPFDLVDLHQEVNIESACKHDANGLRQLLSWLVGQLSKDITLIFVIDGLGYYERNAVVEEMFELVAHISQMMHDATLQATVKLLATSPTSVRRLRQFFRESSILNLAVLSSFDGPSRLRIQRHLHDSLDEHA